MFFINPDSDPNDSDNAAQLKGYDSDESLKKFVKYIVL